MDHFSAPGGPQDMRDVARIAAADALRVKSVIGDKPAPDLDPLLVADRDAVATFEHAFDACDSGRQQTFAARQRRDGAAVDKDRALEFERSANPDLARRDRGRR